MVDVTLVPACENPKCHLYTHGVSFEQPWVETIFNGVERLVHIHVYKVGTLQVRLCDQCHNAVKMIDLMEEEESKRQDQSEGWDRDKRLKEQGYDE